MTQSESRPRYATNVDATTTGLRMGAASMNVIAADGARPLLASRRATGTEPHSHTGNAIPASAAAGSCSGRGKRARCANVDVGTKTSIAADTNAPNRMNGVASTSSDPKTIRKFCSHAIRSGSATRTTTAIEGESAEHRQRGSARRPRLRRGDLRARDVDGHQQYLENEIANPGYASANSGVPSGAVIASIARTTSSDVMSFAAMTA